MKIRNFDHYKFRCSSLGKLLVSERAPIAQDTKLPETTKTYLKELFIAEKFGRRRDISNKYMEKGVLVEEDTLTLVDNVIKRQDASVVIVKNTKQFSNEYITGTPDVIDPKLFEVKSCWDLWTFFNADPMQYYGQVQGYEWLTGQESGILGFALNNTPEHLIVAEKQRQMYRRNLVGMQGTPEWDDMEREVDWSMTFDDIPEEQRLKLFPITYSQNYIDRLIIRINSAREYLNLLLLEWKKSSAIKSLLLMG